MPDYNIFIHTSNEGGMSSKTKPWANQENGGGDSGSGVFTVPKSSFEMSNGEMSMEGASTETGAAALGKVSVVAAIAVTAVKVTDKILTSGFSHLETYTGHYEYSMNLNNFKTTINNIFNPFKLAMNYGRRESQFHLQNQRIEQERTLVGNSLLNISVKGV